MLRKSYEDELRGALGESKYQELCQAYPKVSKAIRARLIALDVNAAVPEFVRAILQDAPAVA